MLSAFLLSAGTSIANFILPTIKCDSPIKYGNSIPWKSSLREALDYAKSEFRPVMVVIWMDGCPSCTELMPKIAQSNEIARLAREEFSVVALNEHIDAVEKFRVDGGYTPRIYFLSPNGQVDLRFFNKWDGEAAYRFYYPTVDGIVKSMKEVIAVYPDRCMGSRPCKIHGRGSKVKK